MFGWVMYSSSNSVARYRGDSREGPKLSDVYALLLGVNWHVLFWSARIEFFVSPTECIHPL
jgi:hypothetical protein